MIQRDVITGGMIKRDVDQERGSRRATASDARERRGRTFLLVRPERKWM